MTWALQRLSTIICLIILILFPHCQQATEKYIKAVLFHREIEFDRSYDLIYLLELLPDDIAVSIDQYKKAVSLNGFSVQIRYPKKIEHMTKEELEEAIGIAQEFRDFAIQKIGIKE